MSRRDTMEETRWRVQGYNSQGAVTHGSLFKTESQAQDYYDALQVPKKVLEVRFAGQARFVAICSTEVSDGSSR